MAYTVMNGPLKVNDYKVLDDFHHTVALVNYVKYAVHRHLQYTDTN